MLCRFARDLFDYRFTRPISASKNSRETEYVYGPNKHLKGYIDQSVLHYSSENLPYHIKNI